MKLSSQEFSIANLILELIAVQELKDIFTHVLSMSFIDVVIMLLNCSKFDS